MPIYLIRHAQSVFNAIYDPDNFIHALTGVQPDNCDILRFDPVTRQADLVSLDS